MPPEPDGFAADIDAALMQQVRDGPKREWKRDEKHYRQENDFGQRLELKEGPAFCDSNTLTGALPRLKTSCSDKTRLPQTGHALAVNFQSHHHPAFSSQKRRLRPFASRRFLAVPQAFRWHVRRCFRLACHPDRQPPLPLHFSDGMTGR